MNIVAIIQARMTSSRLPGKVMLPLPYGGQKTVLEQVAARLQQVKEISKVVIATTINAEDDGIAELCEREEIAYYRGSESHVLSRFYEVAKQERADHIVRVTSDCPCVDVQIVSSLLQQHIEEMNDYTTNALIRHDPHGLDCEIVRFSALETAFENARETFEIEHVTPYIYKTKADQFQIGHRIVEEDVHEIRVTLDVREDYILLCQVYDELLKLDPYFGRDALVALFQSKPWLYEINRRIEQKILCSNLTEELKLLKQYAKKQDLYRALRWLEAVEKE